MLTEEQARHRRDVDELVRLAARDLGIVWREFSSPEAAVRTLRELLPDLMNMYGSAAASLGADWYEELRDAEGIPGRFTALAAELPDTDRTDALAGWGLTPAFKAEPDWAAALTLVSGGLQRIIANADRQSIAMSSVADPKADGWQRVTRGTGCAFCRMLAARGEVFSKTSADFSSHDRCFCLAAPAFGGKPRPVKPYTPSERESSDADRARVREYIAAHPEGG